MSDLAAAERAAQSGLDRELPPLRYDARTTVSPTQRRILLLFAAGVVVAIPLLGPGTFVRVAVAGVTVLYLTDLVFNAWVITGSLRQVRSRSVVVRSDRREPALWPSYTVLCPMYKEVAVLPQFVAAMTALDYPADRLEVLLLLEEDDTETVEAVRAMVLPDSFQIVIVPDSLPRTKPKACNHGLLLASGEHCVIFDTEDVPEPDQLKKAALAFRDAPHRIACLQAPLNFYNPRQNVLTRLFTAEYSLWFDLMLVGLQRLNGPIPLGGTSNHFRTDVLRRLGGWDSYNVTEDCDLGVRLYRQGFGTAMLDSTTYEEANASVKNWIRQRSRWIKGYMQTFLVHTRGVWRRGGRLDPHFLTFVLVVGGKVVSSFLNPLMWALTLFYFVARPIFGPPIEAVYPAPVFYAAVITLLLGNGLFIYVFLLGSAQRGNWDLVKYGLLAPFYWLAMSVAAVKALWQLVRKPHYWEKTDHGLHLPRNEPQRTHI